MEKLVAEFRKFRSEVFGKMTGDVWVYDFENEEFAPLVDNTAPRLKAAR